MFIVNNLITILSKHPVLLAVEMRVCVVGLVKEAIAVPIKACFDQKDASFHPILYNRKYTI